MKMVHVSTLTSENYEEVVTKNEIVLVDIWAPWCGPCKIISPIIDEVASEYGPQVLVGKMNVDENMEFCTSLGVRSIPTLIFYKNGKILEKKVGALSKTDIVSILQNIVDSVDNHDVTS